MSSTYRRPILKRRSQWRTKIQDIIPFQACVSSSWRRQKRSKTPSFLSKFHCSSAIDVCLISCRKHSCRLRNEFHQARLQMQIISQIYPRLKLSATSFRIAKERLCGSDSGRIKCKREGFAELTGWENKPENTLRTCSFASLFRVISRLLNSTDATGVADLLPFPMIFPSIQPN